MEDYSRKVSFINARGERGGELHTDIRVRSADVQWIDTVTQLSQAMLQTDQAGAKSQQWADFLTNHVIVFVCMLYDICSSAFVDG